MSFMIVAGRKINLDTCPDCKGSGHTAATAPEMSRHKTAPLMRTKHLGSGCPRCRGTGVLASSASIASRSWSATMGATS